MALQCSLGNHSIAIRVLSDEKVFKEFGNQENWLQIIDLVHKKTYNILIKLVIKHLDGLAGKKSNQISKAYSVKPSLGKHMIKHSPPIHKTLYLPPPPPS